MDLNARFDGHGHGSVVSIPAVQLFPSNETRVLVDGREILALKASFRIRLVMVWNHLESNCNESASNSQRLEQGARLGQLCRYEKGANEDQTLKSLEFVSQSLYILERSLEGKRAALGEAGNRACQHLCETLMHAFARSLKTQHLKRLRKCADQFHMVQDIALISASRNAAG